MLRIEVFFHYVLPKKEVIKQLKDVPMFRGETPGVPDHFLEEKKLKVAEE